MGNDPGHIRNVVRVRAAGSQVLNEPLDREALTLRGALGVIDGSNDHTVGRAETLRIVILKDVASRRVGSRLEDCNHPPAAVTGLRPLDRQADRGGMMGKVIDHRHAAGHAADLLPSLDPFEGHESLPDRGGRQAARIGHGDHSKQVGEVLIPCERGSEQAKGTAGPDHLELHPLNTGGSEGRPPDRSIRQTVRRQPATRLFGHAGYVGGIGAIGQQSVIRDQIDK